MKESLSGPGRALAQASFVRTLASQIREPSADKVLALEKVLTRLARPEDVDRYLAAMRSCVPTARMLEERYLPPPYTLDDLERCAPGTLGQVYRAHMIENDLRPDFFEPVVPDDDFAYVRLRLLQTHDVWHVVTGYPTTMIGELAIVGFYLGHFEGHMGDRAAYAASFAAILAGSVLLHAALLRQDRITHFYRALFDGWSRGQRAAPLFAHRFEEQWDRPLSEVRRELGIGPSRFARIDPLSLAA